MNTNTYVIPKKFLNKNPSNKTMMRVSWGLLMFLDRKAGRHETYEDTIWRLVASKKLTKEDERDISSTQRKIQKAMEN